MSFFSWLRNRNSGSTSRRLSAPRRRPARSSRLRFEMLEARVLLSTVTVTTSLDELDGDITSIAALMADPGTDRKISLREAIKASNNTAGADSITFADTTSGLPILLTQGTLRITQALTITGLGAANTTVNGQSSSLIFEIGPVGPINDVGPVTLDGLKLTGGKGSSAGAIRSQLVVGAVLTVSNCTIEDNRTTSIFGSQSAGGITSFGALTVINSTISGNSATGDIRRDVGSGGIFSQSAVTVIDSTISGNSTSGRSGGGINAPVMTIRNSTISGNSALLRGAGIAVGYGNGLNVNLTITDSTISGNFATSANRGYSGGGGIFANRGSNVTISSSTISDNFAGFGGGIFVDGPVTVINSTISRNNSTISRNLLAVGGGGIYSTGAVTVNNSTISGNSAEFGGGIYSDYAPTIGNSIVAGNVGLKGPYGSDGPDLYTFGTPTVTNSLIGDNCGTGLMPAPVGAPDIHGNFIGSPDALIDPRLGPLADNGGPTKTMALLPGSPALNTGSNPLAVDAAGMPLSFDQRGLGFARISGGRVDMGAYELQVNQAPTDIALSPGSVAENELAGTSVGTFSTTDPDTGDTFTYTFVSGTGDADNASFTIDAGGNLKTAASFDFETKSSYSIRVLSTDAGGLSVEKVFTISVTNVNEAPTITVPAAQTAYEDVDKAISGLNVGDPEGDNLTVTLQVSHGSLNLGSTAGLIVSGNGSSMVTLAGSLADLNAALAGLVYRGGLNFSGGDTLAITASDGSLSSSSNSVAITVQSAAQQAADLQAQVSALLGSGVMNQGQANSLNVKLDLKNNAGDIGKVQSFLNQVAAYLNAGILTQDQADALTAAGKILWTSLTRR